MSVTMFKYSETCTTRVLSENILKYLNMHKQNVVFLYHRKPSNQANENAKCQKNLTNFSDHQDLFHVYTL